MPDDNRFAGLSNAVEDESGSDSAAESDADPVSESVEDTSEKSESESESEPEPEPEPAAFPFDDTTKKTVYVRQETIDALEDARALVDAQLRTQHDVRDLTGREFYDAAFRLAASDTEGLIEEIREERED